MSKLLTYDEYQEKIKNLKNMSDVSNFAKTLVAPVIQEMLDAEMENHLWYPKNSILWNSSWNSRNWYSKKTIKWDFWNSEINIPRDRKWEFNPIAVKKYETVESGLEEKVVSMYAKWMTTSDINSHLKDIYWVETSATTISNITDKVLPLIKEWQIRPLSSLYTIIYLDWIHFKVRDNWKIVSKCAYIILWINEDWFKEILWIWIWENEWSKFWLWVLNEIKQRWVNDILITCIDWLSWFKEAIKAVYPDSEIQRCIVHKIRNTTKHIPYKEKKKFCADLKLIYNAVTEEAWFKALKDMKKKWKKYEVYLNSWENDWADLSTFFVYPECIRRIIYTTNSIEWLNRQLRKVTKTTSIFPHNDSLQKLLWLAQKDITKKWNIPIPNWWEIYSRFAIMFPKKIKI